MEISLENLKKEFEENPTKVIATVASAAAIVVGLGNMMSAQRNSRTWRREVKRRTKMSKK